MGESQAGEAAKSASSLNQLLAEKQYQLGRGATAAGLSYVRGAYERGGMDQTGKFTAERALARDASVGRLGSFTNPRQMGMSASAKASGIADIGQSEVLSGMEEMQKLRSMLAGQGVQTTNFAEQAGAMSVNAISGMAPNPATSALGLGLGAASAVYGAGRDAGWWGQAPSQGGGRTPTGNWGSFLGTQGASQNINVPVTSLITPSAGFGLGLR